MSKTPDGPPPEQPEDPNLAAFREALARKKAGKSGGSTGPAPAGGKPKPQKPRVKDRMRRRP